MPSRVSSLQPWPRIRESGLPWAGSARRVRPPHATALAAQEPERTQALPFLPAASDALDRRGFVRLINHADEDGAVRIEAIDDEGTAYGPVTPSIGAGEAVHFSAHDLEHGNASRGLPDGVGAGEEDWRLALQSALDIEALAHLRSDTLALTPMHDTVPGEAGMRFSPFVVACALRGADAPDDAPTPAAGLERGGAARAPRRRWADRRAHRYGGIGRGGARRRGRRVVTTSAPHSANQRASPAPQR